MASDYVRKHFARDSSEADWFVDWGLGRELFFEKGYYRSQAPVTFERGE